MRWPFMRVGRDQMELNAFKKQRKKGVFGTPGVVERIAQGGRWLDKVVDTRWGANSNKMSHVYYL